MWRSQLNRNLSNCEVASAFALQCCTSLSYEDPYTGGRPIYWIYQPVKGMKHRMKLCEVWEYKWSEYVTVASLKKSIWNGGISKRSTRRTSGGPSRMPYIPHGTMMTAWWRCWRWWQWRRWWRRRRRRRRRHDSECVNENVTKKSLYMDTYGIILLSNNDQTWTPPAKNSLLSSAACGNLQRPVKWKKSLREV